MSYIKGLDNLLASLQGSLQQKKLMFAKDARCAQPRKTVKQHTHARVAINIFFVLNISFLSALTVATTIMRSDIYLVIFS